MPSPREMLVGGKPRALPPWARGFSAFFLERGSWCWPQGAVTSERPSEGGRRGVPVTRVDESVTHRECVDLQATDVRTLHVDVR